RTPFASSHIEQFPELRYFGQPAFFYGGNSPVQLCRSKSGLADSNMNVHNLSALLHAAPAQSKAVVIPELATSITYESLRQQVMSMAESLAGAGIRPGDRVASVLPNGLPTIVSFLAASIAGTAAPLNPAYRYEEFCFFLDDTNARLLLCPPEGAEEARRAAQERGIPVFNVEMDDGGVVRM